MAENLDLTTPAALENLMVQSSLAWADNPAIRRILEEHILFLWNGGKLQTKELEAGESLRYEGDFIGLMRYIGQGPDFDWVNMRLNNLNAAYEWDGTRTSVYLVDQGIYNTLVKQIVTQIANKK